MILLVLVGNDLKKAICPAIEQAAYILLRRNMSALI